MLAGKKYEAGISAHAEAEIVYKLKPEYTRFVSVVGVDDVTGEKGDAIFSVSADGKLLAQSPLLDGSSLRFWRFDCALPKGAQELFLRVTPGPDSTGWNVVDWVDAGFVLAEN